MTAADRDALTAACRIRWAGDTGSGHCPAHEDRTPSLSVRWRDGGTPLAYCHAGCSYDAIRDALDREHGIHLGGGERGPAPSHTATYTDPHGEPRYQVRRWDGPDGKRIRQYRADGHGGWTPGMDGVTRTPYHLPEVLVARQVVIVEGERKCDLLRAAFAAAGAEGIAITTAPGGAGKWRPEYAPYLAGRDVLVLPDADAPGRAHAEAVAASVRPYAHRLRVLDLPGLPPKGDVADWLGAGHTTTELRALVNAAPEWRATAAGIGTIMAEVRPEVVRWLWRGRIPRGKITVLDGDPGLGKSTLTLDLAARVSTGRAMPDGPPGVSGGVVLASAEDDPADTIRPRLDAAGADCSRVLALGAAEFQTVAQIDVLRAAIARVGAALVVVDPLMAYLGSASELNSYRDQDIRSVLAPLAALAAEMGAAIVLVRHLRKSTADGNPLYRGGGSVGIIGAARCGLLAGRDPDALEQRVLAVTKSNLAREAPSLSYRLDGEDGAVRVKWLGASAHDAAALLAAPASAEDRGDLADAAGWLRGRLADGPAPAKEVAREAAAQGISGMTLRRARARLGVSARRSGYGAEGRWEWSAAASKAINPAIDDHVITYEAPPTNTGVRAKVINREGMSAYGAASAPADAPPGPATGDAASPGGGVHPPPEREPGEDDPRQRADDQDAWPEPMEGLL